MTVPNTPESRFAPVLEQVESIVLRQLDERQARQRLLFQERDARRQRQSARITFLRDHDAVPLDAAAYETWLLAYVLDGGRIAQVIDGEYPSVRVLDEATPVFNNLYRQLPGMAGTDMAVDYYSERIIWSISQPVKLDHIPCLRAEQGLQLHLTKTAVEMYTAAELAAWQNDLTRAGEIELYVDGTTEAGVWTGRAQAFSPAVKIWQENYRSMLGRLPR